MSNYYLITETRYFYDPHGDGDFGGVKKYVSTDQQYDNLPECKELFYIESEIAPGEWKEWLQELTPEVEGKWYSRDGYNCRRTSYTIVKLTYLEYTLLKGLTEQYNCL